MTYSYEVNMLFKKFENTPGASAFDNYQLEHIKRYMQKAFETGFAEGYSESYRDSKKAFV